MLRVGLTGPIAAGKSTVAAVLADRGIPVLDADRLAHDLYAPGSDLARSIHDAFGDGVRTTDGGVDRRALGRIVFADPARLAELESLVHPSLLEELQRRFDELAREGHGVAVVDAALLMRWPRRSTVDLLVGVVADRAARAARLRDRGLDDEAVARRLDAQGDETRLRAEADVLLVNDGTLGELRDKAERLADDLVRRGEDPA